MGGNVPRAMKMVTPDNYQADPLYRRVVNAVRHLQQTKGEITPINVLVTLGMLTPGQVQQWRQGRVLFLEAILQSNLSKTNRILRILRLHARDLEFDFVQIDYVRLGGARKILQFSKSGDANIERAYSRRYLPPEAPKRPPAPPASAAG